MRYALLLVGLVVISLAIVVVPSGDTPCMRWDGWRFEKMWPRPAGCAEVNEGG